MKPALPKTFTPRRWKALRSSASGRGGGQCAWRAPVPLVQWPELDLGVNYDLRLGRINSTNQIELATRRAR